MLHSSHTKNGVDIVSSQFAAGSGKGEMHLLVQTHDAKLSFAEQLTSICEALVEFEHKDGNRAFVPVMCRMMLSDASNQAQFAFSILREHHKGAASYVQQAPLNGSKLAMWIYYREGVTCSVKDASTVVVRGRNYDQYWSTMLCEPLADPHAECLAQLERLEQMLASESLKIDSACVRTWFYVQNVDVNYAAVVAGRNENFDRNGLTRQTHYISSTGICGRHADSRVTSILDAVSMSNLAPQQMQYLYASDHMNRTSDYGVAFERGTYIDFGDRRHVYVSGTASIDRYGKVVHEHDILRQTDRALENIGALLSEAQMNWQDVAYVIVYLRDVGDYYNVSMKLRAFFGNIPFVVLHSPVCRPGWLIEMECMAISERHSDYKDFE